MRRVLLAALILLAGCGAEMTPPAGQGIGLATAKPGGPLAAGASTATLAPIPTATPALPATIPPTSAPPPTSVIPPITQMARDLATIEGVIGDGEKILQIAGLLRDLDAIYPESDQEIGDATAQAYALIDASGQPASIIAIMQGVLSLPAREGETYRGNLGVILDLIGIEFK